MEFKRQGNLRGHKLRWATEKALRMVFNIESDWETSSDEESGKTLTCEDLKAWGGKVLPHLVKMYEEGCTHLKQSEKLVLARILSKYRDVFVKSKTELGLSLAGA